MADISRSDPANSLLWMLNKTFGITVKSRNPTSQTLFKRPLSLEESISKSLAEWCDGYHVRSHFACQVGPGKRVGKNSARAWHWSCQERLSELTEPTTQNMMTTC